MMTDASTAAASRFSMAVAMGSPSISSRRCRQLESSREVGGQAALRRRAIRRARHSGWRGRRREGEGERERESKTWVLMEINGKGGEVTGE